MTDDEQLPKVLQLAWGIEPPRRSGPRPALDVARIVTEAIALADAGGLESCSMPKLAVSLGVGTMSLYRYVSDKGELVTLMRDAAVGPLPDDTPSAPSWRDALEFYSRQMAQRFAAHPWMLDVPIEGFPQTPRLLEWLEFGLAALTGAGLAAADQLGVMLLLDGHVTEAARVSRSAAKSNEGPPRALVADDRFPALAAMLRSGALEATDFRDGGLAHGTALIVSAVEALTSHRVP